jgi:hypothetical protein
MFPYVLMPLIVAVLLLSLAFSQEESAVNFADLNETSVTKKESFMSSDTIFLQRRG